MVNTRVNSQSSKKSSAIEKLSDYQRGKIPADKKKGLQLRNKLSEIRNQKKGGKIKQHRGHLILM